MSLPALRQELALYQGPRSLEGAPTWSLHDPVRNLYFRIDWPTFEILCRWHIGDAQQILDAISKETVLKLDESYIKAVVEFLHKRELTLRASQRDSQAMSNETQKRKQRWYIWLLHRYLFFRVPLWRPDPFLTDTLTQSPILAYCCLPLRVFPPLTLTILTILAPLLSLALTWLPIFNALVGFADIPFILI